MLGLRQGCGWIWGREAKLGWVCGKGRKARLGLELGVGDQAEAWSQSGFRNGEGRLGWVRARLAWV